MKYAVCCQIKDEREYVKEFAEWHLNIGFDDVFFYEDYGSVSHKDIFEDNPHVHVKTIKEAGVENYNGTRTQGALYNKLLADFKREGKYDWAAFIDVDEFIDFEEGYNLEKLCNEFKDTTGVWLAWKMYNANGHIKHPTGSVIKNYPKPLDEKKYQEVDGGGMGMWNKKSIVNLHKANWWFTIHEIGDGCDTRRNGDARAEKIFDKAWIRHYFSKSWEDYCIRILNRGNMNNSIRSFDQFFKQNPDMAPQMRKLIEEQRYNHAKCTMYLSKKLGIISGGNVAEVKLLENETPIPNCVNERVNDDIEILYIN